MNKKVQKNSFDLELKFFYLFFFGQNLVQSYLDS